VVSIRSTSKFRVVRLSRHIGTAPPGWRVRRGTPLPCRRRGIISPPRS